MHCLALFFWRGFPGRRMRLRMLARKTRVSCAAKLTRRCLWNSHKGDNKLLNAAQVVFFCPNETY